MVNNYFYKIPFIKILLVSVVCLFLLSMNCCTEVTSEIIKDNLSPRNEFCVYQMSDEKIKCPSTTISEKGNLVRFIQSDRLLYGGNHRQALISIRIPLKDSCSYSLDECGRTNQKAKIDITESTKRLTGKDSVVLIVKNYGLCQDANLFYLYPDNNFKLSYTPINADGKCSINYYGNAHLRKIRFINRSPVKLVSSIILWPFAFAADVVSSPFQIIWMVLVIRGIDL